MNAILGSTKEYNISDAVSKLKQASKAKFDESVDIAVKLGVDPKHADQVVRGTVSLPHGTGKTVRVLVIAKPEKHDEAREADIRMLQKDLDAKPYVKSTEYVSRDEAAVKMKEEMGEDFISFLGDNPLPPSIDVYLFAGYTNRDSVGKFERYILEYPFVKEVWYEDSLLYLINENVRKISVFLLIISSFLFLIAVTIINNTIRLAIYSKRFLIKTMQLVGATRSFIRKPFLVRSVYHGVLASLVAMLLLIALLYLIEKEFLMLFSFESAKLLIVLSVFLVLAGILINIVSTYLSVNRYLDMSEDKLYN